ncbi:MAG: hypothetical protein ACRCXB_15100 [Aeromonadaceae bacterium]
MEVIDKIAQEFDDWYNAVGVWRDASRQDLWLAWKASRKALCVELPKTPDFSASDEPDLAFEWGVDVMKDLIESAGVTCK